MARIHFIGGEKGGVGKSVLARLLAQYYIDHQWPLQVFDADLSHGAMVRYYADFTETVDVAKFESIDRVAEKVAETGHDVIVDLAAQAARPLNRWMQECGVAEMGDELGIQTVFWHVMDDGTDSQRLLGEIIDTHGSSPAYVVVRNHGRGADFAAFNESAEKYKAEQAGARFMDLPALNAATMRKIDRETASFWSAANNRDSQLGPALGIMDRQRVKIWLGRAYAELDRVLTV